MTESTSSRDADHRRVLRSNLRDAANNHLAEPGASLRQRLSQPFAGRWTRRHWAQASLLATVGALAAAIVPGFSNTIAVPAGARQTTMSLSLPPIPLARLHGASGDSWQIVNVQRGETLSHLLDRLDVPEDDQQRVLKQPDVKKTLTRLKPGTELAFDMPVSGDGTPAELRAFRYDRDDSHRVELSLTGDKVVEKVTERPVEMRTVVLSGTVGRSLFRSARKVGLTPANINTLTDDIFKYDIDFNSDVGADDRFSAVVEQTWREGELLKTGPVLAATFTSDGKLHSGFLYQRNGKAEYFTADGRPLKKTFIRMPIPYARVTSGFGMRKHPILGTMRGHMGIDYAASSGTPIMAAGDARVEFVGWKGGYGRAVILDHGRGYTTLYGHMSAFGSIKVGQRIPQGTVIGRVGMTGLATGPHLHYEFRINGAYRNPLSITMPPPEPLAGSQLAQFRTQVGPALARIEKVEHVIYAGAPAPAASDRRVASVSKAGRKKG